MRKHWTTEETEVAKRMLDAGAEDAEFRVRLDRSKEAAIARMDRIHDGAAVVGRKPTYSVAAGRSPVSEQAYADSVRRLTAPRSITAALMGDPAPEDSAWGKRKIAGEART